MYIRCPLVVRRRKEMGVPGVIDTRPVMANHTVPIYSPTRMNSDISNKASSPRTGIDVIHTTSEVLTDDDKARSNALLEQVTGLRSKVSTTEDKMKLADMLLQLGILYAYNKVTLTHI